MELSILLAQKICSMFLMSVIGFIVVKAGLLKAKDSKILSNLVVYVCIPCMTVKAFQISYTKDKMSGLMLAVAAVIGIHIFFIGFTKLLQPVLHFSSIEKASLIYTNCGNLIVPLVSSVLGLKWVFYTSAFMMVQTVLIWTHGLALISRSKENNLKKILINPCMIAVVLGLLLFVAKIQIPALIGDCMTGFADMIAPASMLVIGMLMGEVDLKWVFRQKRPYFICFIRLIIMPVAVAIVFRFTGLLGLHKDAEKILLVVLLAAAAPAAATVTQMAQVFDGDATYASVINVMSVIFCILTMPLVVFFFEAMI